MAQNSAAFGTRRPRRWLWRLALLVPLIAVLLGGLWTWFALNWSYSEGERAGVLQKFSRKGWICKTYEGELAQYVVGGVAPQIWYFSTRDEKLAEKLTAVVGEQIRKTSWPRLTPWQLNHIALVAPPELEPGFHCWRGI